ncbi:MAG: undecaprenyl-phosphate glucose phosphotransferase [Tunicatimonas sp.]
MISFNKLKKNRYSKSLVVLLLLLDVLFVLFSFEVGYIAANGSDSVWQDHYVSFATIFVLAWVVSALFCEIYQTENLSKVKTILSSTLLSFVFHFFIISLYLFGFNAFHYPSNFLIVTYAICVVSIIGLKVVLLKSYQYYRNLDKNRKKVIVIGYTSSGRSLYEFFVNNQALAYKFMGFFSDQTTVVPEHQALIRGDLSEVRDYCVRENIDEIFYALPNNIEYVRSLAKFADDNYIYFGLVQDAGGLLESKVDTHLFDNGKIPILTPRREPLRFFFNRQVKRAFDIAFSSLVIAILFPFIIPPIALLIKMDSPGPVFFKQLRSGRNGKPFWCYKFRTMSVNGQSDSVQAKKNDARITRIGSFLRKTSLDELPQFFNVLIGNMSVVGPRPHMLKHTEEYSAIIENFKVRHFINSGITGYAQVNGYRGETKDNSAMEKRVQYDTWYLENWSLSLDLKIIFMTVWNAVRGEENAY